MHKTTVVNETQTLALPTLLLWYRLMVKLHWTSVDEVIRDKRIQILHMQKYINTMTSVLTTCAQDDEGYRANYRPFPIGNTHDTGQTSSAA